MKKLIPSDMQAKITPINVTGSYDWKTQTYKFDSCKWGTGTSTSNQTCSGQYSFVDDNPMDNYSD